MALAVLEDDTIVHGPLEVMTTTNEEDGMSGASNLSSDFIKGRKVINLDSEDYDTITTGACRCLSAVPPHPPCSASLPREANDAGTTSRLQVAWADTQALTSTRAVARLSFRHGLSWLPSTTNTTLSLASLHIGEANASIASSADIILTIPSGEGAEFVKQQEDQMNQWLREEYGNGDPNIHCTITKCTPTDTVIDTKAFETLMSCLEQIPQGVVKMSETMKDTRDF